MASWLERKNARHAVGGHFGKAPLSSRSRANDRRTPSIKARPDLGFLRVIHRFTREDHVVACGM